MNTQTLHEISGCTDYLQHNATGCPILRAEAIARLNVRQQSRNLYTNIGETEIEREIRREARSAQ